MEPQKDYYVTIERRPSGGVQAWLGRDNETVKVRCLPPNDACEWTDEQALEEAKKWAVAWLTVYFAIRDRLTRAVPAKRRRS